MPDPTTQDLITETRTKLDELIAQIAVLQTAISTQVPPALIFALIDARDKLQEMIAKLQADLNRLIEYQNAFVDPDNSSLSDWNATLALYEINLTVVSGGLAPNDSGWDKDQERVRAAYKAVYKIIQKIANELYNGDVVRGILQFIDTFGGTTIQLTLERSSGTTPYAETQNPGGGIIFLYTAPDTEWRQDDINRGYIVHTAENITHEFGHVLAFRNGADNSAIYQEWNSIRNFINPFDTTVGWTVEDFNLRLQNRARIGDLPSNELEHERIANMFEAFITGYQPNLSPNPFSEQESRAAWAMWTFMTATPPPYDPTSQETLDDPQKTVWIDLTRSTRPVGNGILHWIQNYGNE